jgi:glycosyltransferase involved in cell wall biosynthesis
MKIIQVFRKKNARFFSIENVFGRINRAWPSAEKPEELNLPHSGIAFSNLLFLLKNCKPRKNTIFHVTGDAHYAVLALPRNSTILTIHDSVFFEQHKGLKLWLLKKILLDIPVWHCRYITTISEKSKQEIMENTACDPLKIKVIPNPVSPAIYFQPKEFNQESPVLLFIGVKPNKNLERVCEAIQNITCKLQIIGKLFENQELILKEFGIQYEAVNGISEEEVATKYAEADIILFPSIYEGFGLPVIEGFKAGRVVVTSNIRPMIDIAEDAACLVDPLDVHSIRAGVLKTIHDKPYREQLITRGFEVVKKYQPETIALQYYQLYQEVYNKTCVE